METENKAEVAEVEIIEAAPVVEEKIDIAELDPVEQGMAKDLGIVPKEEKKEDVKVSDEKKSFEDVEKNEKENLGSYNKNEQALYFKWKADKKVRQEAQAERDLTVLREKSLKTELEKAREEGSLTVGKLDKINALLKGDAENITIEAIQEILSTGKKEVVSEEKPLTKNDLVEIEREREEKARQAKALNDHFVTRMNTLDEYGKTKFENYEEVISCAKAVLDGTVELPEAIDSKAIAARLVAKVNDANSDEDDISDFVLGVAKLNPNYGKQVAKGDKKLDGKVSSEDIDKIVKNAAKTQSSATVSGGNSRRVVSYDDLTVEDAAKLSTEQYMKLPREVRQRLLRE